MQCLWQAGPRPMYSPSYIAHCTELSTGCPAAVQKAFQAFVFGQLIVTVSSTLQLHLLIPFQNYSPISNGHVHSQLHGHLTIHGDKTDSKCMVAQYTSVLIFKPCTCIL